MKKSRLFGFLCASFLALVITTSHAALVSRAGGTMVYDTDLDITWLADANYSATSGYDDDGLMTFNTAKTWANQLVYAGFTEWRLATIDRDDPTCGQQSVIGYRFGFNCSGGEYGHLFHTELGGITHQYIIDSSDPDVSLFTNIMEGVYWADTYMSSVSSNDQYGVFKFYNGEQNAATVNIFYYAWAVHDGDIGAVTVPAAVWLFGSGLLGLIRIARKKAV